jgi:long-subunit acyl-CoA synthetase (AMP-forming)
VTVATAAMLEPQVARLAQSLARARPRVLGLIADNGPDWLAADLAAERAGVPLVPLPAFFTPAQLAHAVAASGMDALLCDAPALAGALGFAAPSAIEGSALGWHRRDTAPVPMPAGTAKVTFTSGTTGTPKAVFLGAHAQQAVARALDEATRALGLKRHLCLLPLAVLLENVAGARTALAAGIECIVPPLAETGMRGATGFDPLACLGALARWNAESAILLPQMMHALTAALEAGAPCPPRLRFAAVGGAKVSPSLLLRARAAGLPAYEGYGLTECASVVALNLPGADRPGSVGRPLAHARVRIADDGEIVASDVRTGDLGRLDDDGFLHVEGRRKHVIITSFGRNVSPEWPEAELAAGGAIAQCAVFGEAQPSLGAVLVPRAPAMTDADLQAEVERANARLPDYARIGAWIRADAPFNPATGTLTTNGRVRRDAVWARYGARLDAQFSIRTGVPAHAVL